MKNLLIFYTICIFHNALLAQKTYCFSLTKLSDVGLDVTYQFNHTASESAVGSVYIKGTGTLSLNEALLGPNGSSTFSRTFIWTKSGPGAYDVEITDFGCVTATNNDPMTSCFAALPVELTTFIATPLSITVKIEWNTASEKNSSHYEVERSIDGKMFEKIGIVKSNGNSYSKQSYELIDEKPMIGINYYRLKMVDLDASFEYSKVVSVYMNKNRNEKIFTISPNPASDRVTFNLSKDEGADAAIEIWDITGRLIYLRKLNKDDNLSNIDWNTEGVSKGIYFATFTNGGEKSTKKLIIN